MSNKEYAEDEYRHRVMARLYFKHKVKEMDFAKKITDYIYSYYLYIKSEAEPNTKIQPTKPEDLCDYLVYGWSK